SMREIFKCYKGPYDLSYATPIFNEPRRPPTPNRDWNKTLPAAQGNAQSWISTLAKQTDARSSFNELLDTPIDFSNFIMNRLSVDTLTPKLLFYGFVVNRESALDVYSKRRIIIVTELKIVEWHSYKHLDWISLSNLTVEERFAFNVSLRMFTKSIVIQRRVEDLQVGVERYQKRLNLTKPDTYRSDLMKDLLVEDSMRETSKCYKGPYDLSYAAPIINKLTNLTFEERFAFNISLGMFKRSIVIQRRVEDLQLGIESYQKKLNLIKPDTYHSNMKHKEAYTSYSNPKGFIYKNKDKQNRLMRIDELHKFSDGTLNDVRTSWDDRLKGIRMKYLP
nr:hypothetical protein [Tanacetum cinerariifolium]